MQPPCKVTGRVRQPSTVWWTCTLSVEKLLGTTLYLPATTIATNRRSLLESCGFRLQHTFPCKVQICRIPLCLHQPGFGCNNQDVLCGLWPWPWVSNAVNAARQPNPHSSNTLSLLRRCCTRYLLYRTYATPRKRLTQRCSPVQSSTTQVKAQVRYACHAPVNSLLLDFLGFLDQFFFSTMYLHSCTSESYDFHRTRRTLHAKPRLA